MITTTNIMKRFALISMMLFIASSASGNPAIPKYIGVSGAEEKGTNGIYERVPEDEQIPGSMPEWCQKQNHDNSIAYEKDSVDGDMWWITTYDPEADSSAEYFAPNSSGTREPLPPVMGWCQIVPCESETKITLKYLYNKKDVKRFLHFGKVPEQKVDEENPPQPAEEEKPVTLDANFYKTLLREVGYPVHKDFHSHSEESEDKKVDEEKPPQPVGKADKYVEDLKACLERTRKELQTLKSRFQTVRHLSARRREDIDERVKQFKNLNERHKKVERLLKTTRRELEKANAERAATYKLLKATRRRAVKNNETRTQQLKEIQRLKEAADVDNDCCVCMEKAKTHACVPCGHKCLCEDKKCRPEDGLCPICREKCYGFMEVFEC